jgi:GTPase SAR1 family protein
MDTQQSQQSVVLLRRLPKVRFRVLIIGRANAGKTSILQRICETTESPIVYRGGEEVRGPILSFSTLISRPTRFNLIRLWMLVTTVLLSGCL